MVLVVAACSGGSTDPSATSTPARATHDPSASAPSSDPSLTEWEDAGTIELPPSGPVGDAWTETFRIPYGETERTLATGTTGEGDTFGPEYGAQAPDGSWWFLDPGQLRVAHFDAQGTYLGQVRIKPDNLASGRYFQFQSPRVLADGTVVATSHDLPERTNLLLVHDDEQELVTVADELISVRADDGQTLYGEHDNNLVAIDVDDGSVTPVEWFTSRSGQRYQFQASQSTFRLELADHDPPVRRQWTVTGATTGQPISAVKQIATDEAGRFHLLLSGAEEHQDDEQLTQVSAYVRLSADGQLETVEPTTNPFTSAHLGSAHHLGVPVGDTIPWLMFLEEDGVQILQRSEID